MRSGLIDRGLSSPPSPHRRRRLFTATATVSSSPLSVHRRHLYTIAPSSQPSSLHCHILITCLFGTPPPSRHHPLGSRGRMRPCASAPCPCALAPPPVLVDKARRCFASVWALPTQLGTVAMGVRGCLGMLLNHSPHTAPLISCERRACARRRSLGVRRRWQLASTSGTTVNIDVTCAVGTSEPSALCSITVAVILMQITIETYYASLQRTESYSDPTFAVRSILSTVYFETVQAVALSDDAD